MMWIIVQDSVLSLAKKIEVEMNIYPIIKNCYIILINKSILLHLHYDCNLIYKSTKAYIIP